MTKSLRQIVNDYESGESTIYKISCLEYAWSLAKHSLQKRILTK